MLSVKQGDIKYYLSNLWYYSISDWTSVTQNISKHSTHYANDLKTYDITIIRILETLSFDKYYIIWYHIHNKLIVYRMIMKS